jgi:flagellar hook-associated protein 2
VLVNGVQATRSSNSLSDLVPGLTLDLLGKPADGLPRTITVARDSTGTASKVQALVDGLNAVLTSVASNTAYNVKSGSGGPLVGDGTARSLSTSLFSLASAGGAAGGMPLSALGISTTRDGRFTFSSDTLSKALASSPDAVATALSGFGNAVATYAKSTSDLGGLLANRRDGAQADADARQKQYDDMEVRMAQIETRYKAQYSALETAMASLKSQQSTMTAALSGLGSSS